MVLTPDLLTSLAIVAVSLYTLVTAAGQAVSRSLALARHYGVPDVIVGMTVLAVGTSLPELASNVVASAGIAAGTLDYEVTSAVVLGGNLGSATVQQLLLVGILVLGYGRIDPPDSFLRAHYLPMVAGLALALALAWDGTLSRLEGVVLLAAYGAYVVDSYRRRPLGSGSGPPSDAVRRDLILTAGALALVLASASLLLWVVDGVVAVLDLGGSTVGVLTIGMAAALPELSTVLDAIRRRTPDVALGVLIGSNLVNPLLGLGLGAVVSTYHVPDPVRLWDFPFKLLAAVAVLAFLRFGPDRALTRRAGAYLVAAYFLYLSGRLLVFTAT